MSSTCTLALVQMVSSHLVEPNLYCAESLILEAAAGAPDAVFLPENFAALAAEDPVAIGSTESTDAAPIQTFLGDMARRTGTWIFGGTLPLGRRPDGSAVPGNRVRAASLVFDPSGEPAARYDKVHMFDVDVSDNQGVYRESATFEAGETPAIVDCPFGRVGLSVCYDLRFPEFFRLLFRQGVDMVAVPSAFTEVTGSAHFEVLMRARAIENTCYMIAACQGGEHDSGRRTHGHSMVVSPWGEVIGELGQGEGVLRVECRLDELTRIRQEMPFLTQARLLD